MGIKTEQNIPAGTRGSEAQTVNSGASVIIVVIPPTLFASIAQMVGHATVNRRVVGSSPTRSANYIRL